MFVQNEGLKILYLLKNYFVYYESYEQVSD